MDDVAVEGQSLEERVLRNCNKCSRLTIVANKHPSELQFERLCEFLSSALRPPAPSIGAWPDQTQWVELALDPLFRESASVWCKRSTFKSLQTSLEKFCSRGSLAREGHLEEERKWWRRHRVNLINHEKPWRWSNGDEDWAGAIREACVKLLMPIKEVKTTVKRMRLNEYKANKENPS